MTTQRGRPPQHQGKEVDTLDELEQQAKKRIESDGRVPLNGQMKLGWSDQDPDYHYFWASNSEHQPLSLADLLSSGYEFVRYKHGQHQGDKVVKNSRSSMLYLMRIPVKMHEENMAHEQKRLDMVEQQLLEVGQREYAGDSKELGKGKPISAAYTESPLMGKE